MYSISGVESGMLQSISPHSNTPLHANANPISAVCCLCFAHGKGFVNMSVV